MNMSKAKVVTSGRRKKAKDTEQEVSSFYQRQSQVPLPDKKLVSRKTAMAKSVLQKPLADCYIVTSTVQGRGRAGIVFKVG